MNSTVSETPMYVPNKTLLTPAGVCAIIKTCSQMGVRELHFGELKIILGPVVSLAPTHDVFVPGKVTQAAEEIAQKVHTQENINSAEEDHSQLMIEDPYEYEQRILRMQRDGSIGKEI